jgi:putative transposase
MALAEHSELCRRHGISDNTFHRWKRKYGGMEIPDARRLKQLEEENRQLKRIVEASDLATLVRAAAAAPRGAAQARKAGAQ